ncbi:hypothetical protein Q3G72_025216 [Acer saccharum]|nr:hypothetical protein Q3G72_025216 [Acer saccharum]
MSSFIMSARFLGTHVEFRVENSEMYTMAQLWTDVYMSCCYTFLEPSEGFKVEVRVPWCAEFKLLKDDKDLQVIFKMFAERKLSTIRVDFELRPFASLPLKAKDIPHAHMDSSFSSTNGTPSRTEVSANFLQISTDDDEEYVPYSSSGWTADADDEENNIDDEVAGKDKDIAESDNNSTDEQLFNAASFQFDEEFMELADNDEKEGQSRPRKGRPFRVTNDGRVALEVKSISKQTPKKRALEVGSSSIAPNIRRRVEVFTQVPPTITQNQVEGNASQHGDVSSQPLTVNAPLHSSGNASQPTQSIANSGTIAGLDIDWSPIF